jgi:hypothetical protein
MISWRVLLEILAGGLSAASAPKDKKREQPRRITNR